MAIPVVPLVLGGGFAALLLAGGKKTTPGVAPASAGVSATPTTQSTGGENGGAQVPSHSDVDASDGEVNTNVGSRGEVNQGYLTAPTAPSAPGTSGSPSTASGVEGLAGGFASGYEAGGDSWANPTAPSGSGALGQIGVVGGMTTRAVSDTFKTWGEAFGAIW